MASLVLSLRSRLGTLRRLDHHGVSGCNIEKVEGDHPGFVWWIVLGIWV